jgi:light-regulated signal transduction histidine kinase (bacteriophytochrome)
MVDVAVHELRNSLSAIQLGVELLSRRDNAAHHPAFSAVLAHMDSAAQRAQASTVELEDLYRVSAGQPIVVSPVPLFLHAVVRDALDASRLIVPGVVVEHDRLGAGDCVGDPARMAQFLALALEDLCAVSTPALVIVISEVAGERFRIAVHVDGVRGAAPASQEPVTRLAQSQARRRVMLQAIAQAHGGHVRFDGAHAQGSLIDGTFSSLVGPRAS